MAGSSTSLYEVDIHGAGKELLRCVRAFAKRGWCQGTSGNFSVRLAKRPLRLLITKTGRHKADLGLDDLMVVGVDGAADEDQSDRPSAEALLHSTVADRTGAGAVLHLHTIWNTLLGERFRDVGGLDIAGYEMLKGLEGVRSHEETVRVPVLANTQDMKALAGGIRKLLAQRPGLVGFLIAGHGLYAWGETLSQARRHVEIFEFLFELAGRRMAFAPFPA